MSINGISSNTVGALTALSNQQDTDPSGAADGAAAASTPAASSTVSKPGELMAKLSQLLQQDPAKFKQVTQQISDELKSAATNATGPQAQFLSKLSDNFAQASSTGNLSAFQPPRTEAGGAGAAHHHHHGGGHHAAGGAGAGGASAGGLESVLSTALEQVNRALGGNSASATIPAAS